MSATNSKEPENTLVRSSEMHRVVDLALGHIGGDLVQRGGELQK